MSAHAKLAEHIMAMSGDPYFAGHPEWEFIVESARKAKAEADIAPDLLAALQSIADHEPAGARDEWTEAAAYTAVQEIARAAIAKAEGTK